MGRYGTTPSAWPSRRKLVRSTLVKVNHRASLESALVSWMHRICCDNMNAKRAYPADKGKFEVALTYFGQFQPRRLLRTDMLTCLFWFYKIILLTWYLPQTINRHGHLWARYQKFKTPWISCCSGLCPFCEQTVTKICGCAFSREALWFRCWPESQMFPPSWNAW